MPRIRTMGAGLGGSTAKNLNVNGNTGGGNKKQGLATTTNTGVSFASNAIKNKAYGENRDFIFCVNQLGGIGGKSKMFATTADGVKDCVEGPVCPVKEVTHAYLTAFGRHPDASGIKTYCDNFRKKNWTLEMIIRDLVNSDEGQNTLAAITPAFNVQAMLDVERFDGDFAAKLRDHIVNALASSSTGPLALSLSEISSALTITHDDNLEDVVGRWMVNYTFSYEHSVYGLISGSGDLFVYVVDTIRPTIVSIELFAGTNTPVQTNYGIGQVMNIRATFSEDVSAIGLNPTLVLSNGAEATYSSGDDNIFEFVYTVGEGDNNITDDSGIQSIIDGLVDLYAVGFGGGQITDDQGQFQGNNDLNLDVGDFFEDEGYNLGVAVDSKSPSMPITSTTTGVSNRHHNGDVDLVFTASEDITGFSESDIVYDLASGTLSNFDDLNAPVYTATFTPTAGFQGECSVSVADGAFTDAVGNPNTAASSFGWHHDAATPTMTIAGPSPGSTINDESVELTLEASHILENFVVGDIVVSSGTLSDFDDTNAPFYTVTFTHDADGPYSVNVGEFQNLHGSSGGATGLTWIYDSTTPNITNIEVGGIDPFIIGDTVSFTATFNEPVVVTGTPTLLLSNGAVATYSPGSSSNNEELVFIYQVASGDSDSTTVQVDGVGGNGTIKDAAGNSLNGAMPSQTVVQVDATRPTMTIASSDVSVNGFHNGAVALVFTASEDLNNFQESDITVTNGSLSNFDDSNAPVYTATFTPTAGFQGECSVSVAIGAITDVVGNVNAVASNTFTWTNDTIDPTLVSVEMLSTDGSSNDSTTFGVGHVISIIAKFSEPVSATGTSVPVLNLSNGSDTTTVADVPGNDDKLLFTYTVLPGDNSDNALQVIGASGPIGGGSITDRAGNFFAGLAESSNQNITHDNTSIFVVDTVSPSMVISSTTVTSGATTNDASIVLNFAVSNNNGDGAYYFNSNDISVEKDNQLLSSTESGALLSSFNGIQGASSYTATFTPGSAGAGAYKISVKADEFTDIADNYNTLSNIFSWSYDNTPPTLISVAAAVSNAGPTGAAIVDSDVNITVEFSESVVTGSAAQLSLSNGAVASYSSGSGTDTLIFTYTVEDDISESTSALIAVSNAGGDITDAAGNTFSSSSLGAWPRNLNIVVEATKPTMTISVQGVISGGYDNLTSRTVTFTASEATTDFAVGDIVVTNGSLTNFAATNASVYTATVAPTAGATQCSVSVPAASFSDLVGNNNTASNTFAWIYDFTSPTMTITSGSVNTNEYLNNYSLLGLTFTSSEETNNFVESDISVVGGVLSNFAAEVPADSTTCSCIYTADFTPTILNGLATITVPAASFSDLAGNNIVQPAQFNLNYDNTAPKLTNVSASILSNAGPTGVAIIGSVLTISLDFDELVNWSGGSNQGVFGGNWFVYSSGTGTNSLVFQHTVGSLDTSGTLTLPVATTINLDDKIKDLAGNPWNPAQAGQAYGSSAYNTNITVDAIKPIMTITSTTQVNGAALVNSGSANGAVNFKFESSEDTTNFVVGDITVTNGSLTNFAATNDPKIYTATFTPTAGFEGACSVGVADGAFTDAAGNQNPASGNFNWTNDTTEPTMTISSTTLVNGAALVNSGSANGAVNFKFESSEDTTNFVVGDITVTNGSLSSFDDTAAPVYTVTFTPGSAGTCSVSVAANKFTDAAGNQNTASGNFNWTNDTTAPTMTITSTTLVNGAALVTTGSANGAVNFKFESSEDTTDFVVGDITVTENGQPVTGSFNDAQGATTFAADPNDPKIYTATFTPTAGFQGACSVSVAANKFTDAAGNQNTGLDAVGASSEFNWTNDTIAPTMTISQAFSNSGIYSSTTANGNVTGYGNTGVINLLLETSEVPLNVLTVSDVTVNSSGAAPTLLLVGLSQTQYNLTLTGTNIVANNDTIIVSVAANKFKDLAGNNNTISNTFTWNFDTSAPTLTPGTPITTPSNNTAPSYDFESDEAGTLTSTLGFTSSASITTGSNQTVTFDTLSDGTYSGETITVTDAAGNASSLTIPDFEIDTTAPTAAITYSAAGPYKQGDTTTITATFNENMKTTPKPQITISGVSSVNAADMTADVNGDSKIWTYAYTAPAGNDTDIITLSTGQDLAGNVVSAAPTNNEITVDNTPPTMTITSGTVTSGATTNDTSIELTFTANEDTADFVESDITVTENGVAVTGSFNDAQGATTFAADPNDPKIYTATFTPTAEGVCNISVAANKFTDAAGNLNTVSVTANGQAGPFVWNYDATAPEVSIPTVLGITATQGSYSISSAGGLPNTIPITVGFTEPIAYGSASPTLVFNSGQNQLVATIVSASGVTAIFEIDLSNQNVTAQPTNTVTPSYITPGITDVAGNPLAPQSVVNGITQTNQPQPPFSAQLGGVSIVA